jgi:flotillin
MDTLILLAIGVVALVVVVFILIQAIGRMLRKVGPNQALIVYGARGTKVVTGGAHFVLPLYQRAQDFSLELMSFDVAPSQDLYTTQGVAVNVEAVTQIKVRSDEESVKTAAEQFLSKSQQERDPPGHGRSPAWHRWSAYSRRLGEGPRERRLKDA